MRAFSIPALVLTLFLCLSWNQQGKNGTDVQLTIPESSKAMIKKLEDTMQGVWKLTEYKTTKLPTEGRSDVGFCMIQGNYISIELHIGWLSEDGVRFNRKDFQSGMNHFEIDQTGRMQTFTVIGTFMNQGYQIGFEEPGYKRTYRVEAILDQMTLRGDDGSKFTFERMLDTRVKRDVYGRPIPEKKKDAAKPAEAKTDKPTDDDDKPPEDKTPPEKKDDKPPEEMIGGGGVPRG